MRLLVWELWSLQAWTHRVKNKSGWKSSQVCTKNKLNKHGVGLFFFKKPPFQDKRLDSIKVIILFKHILIFFFFFFFDHATFYYKMAGQENCGLHPQSPFFYNCLCVLPTYAGVMPPNVGWICSSCMAHVMSCKTDCSWRARRAPGCGRNWVKLIKTAEPQPSSKAKIHFLRHILICDSDEKCCSFPSLRKKCFNGEWKECPS